MVQHKAANRASTGLATLDEILHGGLPIGELYVVNGAPGSGKSTLALHFLSAAAEDEKVMCLALSQRVQSLRQTATSVGLDVSNIAFCDLSSIAAIKALGQHQTIFDTSEVELVETMKAIMETIDAAQPSRVVFDGISQLRMLSRNEMTYRQQLFMLRDYMASRAITVMLTDSPEAASGDRELVAMAHGIITLSLSTTSHGSDHRYLRVSKIRGSSYEPGVHDFEITDNGLQVYRSHRQAEGLKIATAESLQLAKAEKRTSGLAGLDALIGGGLLSGTTCLLLGPSGTGKTSIATLFLYRFAQQGGKASIFLFDESINTFARRSQGLGMNLAPLVEQNRLRLHELSFGNITPGKFSTLVDRDVEDWGAEMVVIDTLTGYMNAMPGRDRLIAQMHELMKRLNKRGVLTFLMVAQRGVIGLSMDMAVDISYLADTVLLMRHFEAAGEIRQAISVYKNRYGIHQRHICEVKIQEGSIQIGKPLGRFSGILSGLPRNIDEPHDYTIDSDRTMHNDEN